MTPTGLAKLIRARAEGPGRLLVALAGPPASGKSTLAAALAEALSPGARVVPMDGFHYDDAVLEARGLRARKGSPPTFDAMGFLHLLRRLREEEEVAIPIFDRAMELSRAGADIVGPEDRILIVEGNYLLLDEDPWRAMAPMFDLTVFLDVPEAELVRRLTARWKHHGREDQAARDWIESNDLPNALTVITRSRPAEITLRNL
ncbi:nucleoside/nucleotide kinase family protein [Rhodobacter sp. SGA-6-6]|uniref:nucleoside/nucleotide kinase family protein n=1 Tax=Rhodobacter sp. SGA-6-6 TaxID=2710882 RepID=UPI0013EA0F66|nr:nucleoside/nucleotide kinase family protein [Rhodobacter sp. SGA-6-6]NGM44679.1 nucleoside/nucleotide kinase family protein [Rhodobacter sp. SGA-6-6]